MSVYSTVPYHLCLEAFLGSRASTTQICNRPSPSRLSLKSPDLPKLSAYTLGSRPPSLVWPSLLRPSIAAIHSTGILTRFPSTTRFRLALGADLPCADERCAGTLGLPAGEIFTPLIVTHVSIRTSDTSSMSRDTPSQAYRTLPYHAYKSMHPQFRYTA